MAGGDGPNLRMQSERSTAGRVVCFFVPLGTTDSLECAVVLLCTLLW